MSVSKAKKLLREAAHASDRLNRHLLVAAALDAALPRTPIVVGGTAFEYWTRAAYHETDLDLCVSLGRQGAAAFQELGFEREGRHWYAPRARVAVEVPDSVLDGALDRTVRIHVSAGEVTIIGPEDLYLDRVRQATVRPTQNGDAFLGAVALFAALHDSLDMKYVRTRLRDEAGSLGEVMRRVDSRVRRRVRRALSSP